MELFSKWQLVEAVDEPHEYWITPKDADPDAPLEQQRYPVFDVCDRLDVKAVDDAAPDEVLGIVEEHDHEAVWVSEVEEERVKEVKTEVVERTAYYEEEPPETRYTPVGRIEATEFLQNRGVESGEVEDAWIYPDRTEFVCVYTMVDDAGEASRVVWRSSELSSRELDLLRTGESLDEEESLAVQVRERAEEIKENSPFADTYAEYLAGVEFGVESMSWLGKIFDRNRGAYTPAEEVLKEKVEGYDWVQEEGLDDTIRGL